MSVSQTIRSLREGAGYSQEDLARIIGVTRSAVAQWENDITLPKMGNVRKLAEAFNVRVSALIGDTDQNPPALVRMRPLGRVHAGPFSDEDGSPSKLIEIPASILQSHPNAQAILVEGQCMNRFAPEGMAVIIDPDLEPTNGKAVVVETDDHQALIRRWYRGGNTLMLVADSTEQFDDIVLGTETSVRVIGTVISVQSPVEVEG